jgi:hypothetical protein
MRFKMQGYEIMRRFFEKPEMRQRYHGDKFFSTIEELINNKVKFFGFEKYNDQCGEYVILCNMEDDENAKLKKNAEEMISLAYSIYNSIRVSNYIATLRYFVSLVKLNIFYFKCEYNVLNCRTM